MWWGIALVKLKQYDLALSKFEKASQLDQNLDRCNSVCFYRVFWDQEKNGSTGIDIFKVVETGTLPLMDIGIAGHDGGQIGAGVVRAPIECFESALTAYKARYGSA